MLIYVSTTRPVDLGPNSAFPPAEDILWATWFRCLALWFRGWLPAEPQQDVLPAVPAAQPPAPAPACDCPAVRAAGRGPSHAAACLHSLLGRDVTEAQWEQKTFSLHKWQGQEVSAEGERRNASSARAPTPEG